MKRITRCAYVLFLCLAAASLFSAPLEAKLPEGKVVKFTHNSEPVGLQGLICSVEYQGDDGILYSIEYRYWGMNNAQMSIRRVIDWREGKKDRQSVEMIYQNPNLMGVFSIDVAPGKHLMLELDRFNRLLVTEHANVPTT